MISNYFSKSKPMHYVMVGLLLLFVFVATRFSYISNNISLSVVTKEIGLFIVCLYAVFVFDFFASRNKLTKKNSYKILLFVLFFTILPQTLLHSKILIANLFILLAMRRLISLRTQKDIKKKFFDASVWVAVATLFYFWSGLFFILVFLAIITYTIADVKNYVISLIAIITVVVLVVSYLIIMDIDILIFVQNWLDSNAVYSLDYSALNSKRIIVGAAVLLIFGLWSLFYYIRNIKLQMKSYKPSFKLIIVTAILALIIIVIAPEKTGGEFIFLFAPLSIITTNYLEVISRTWLKETLFWMLMVTPIALLLL